MTTLLTPDGVRLRVRHVPAAGSAGGARSTAVVVCHGFTGSLDRPAYRAVLERVGHTLPAIGFDFRGHGRSGGVTTVGDREIVDLETVVRWARSLGYVRVATLGFSMGGAVVLRHGGLVGGVDAVASVSAPAWWFYRGTWAMRRLHWLIESRTGRQVSRSWRGTRIDAAGWPSPPPVPPDEAVPGIAPVPLLIVHGDADPFFPLDHAYAIDAAAGAGHELRVWPGFGHAEGAMTHTRTDAVARWLLAAATQRQTAPDPEVSAR